MTNTRQNLVLHLSGAAQPLHVALDPAEADALVEQLPEFMAAGSARTLKTADGGRFSVNFAHVATAHVENSRGDANAYGAPSRGTGFAR
ncbi:hypothetical protein HUO13_00970 [Saccharopolyspora erythraea]|uniref:hypothetical protein n=1 Tax=Saccharopolyspora erythraea TaxID=1836 RepID=UPI001BAC37BC|nr:hypothetical protein [Saccharopolyspora erythraea]QUG99561.1 hypothetical protein HUO13_00970 [Saccharopolyspora erythraea]